MRSLALPLLLLLLAPHARAWTSERAAEEACSQPLPGAHYAHDPSAMQASARELMVYYQRRLEGEDSPPPPRMSPADFQFAADATVRSALQGLSGARDIIRARDEHLPSDYLRHLTVDMHTPAGGRQFWPGAIEAYATAADAWATLVSRVTQARQQIEADCDRWRRGRQTARDAVTRGDALAANGQWEAAQAEYRRALETAPNDAAARNGIARAQRGKAQAERDAQQQAEEAARSQRQPSTTTTAQAQPLDDEGFDLGRASPERQGTTRAPGTSVPRGASSGNERSAAEQRFRESQRLAEQRARDDQRRAAEQRAREEAHQQATQQAVDKVVRDTKEVLEHNPDAADPLLAIAGGSLVALGAIALADGTMRGEPGAQLLLGVLSLVGSALALSQSAVDIDTHDDTTRRWLGTAPWWGRAELRGGFGFGVAHVAKERIQSTRTMGPGALPGLGGELVGRVGPVRVASRGALRWADFAVEGLDETRGHKGFEYSIAPGLQFFGGGLLSPWAEWRLMAYPNCGADLEPFELDGDRLLACQGPEHWSVGPRYGFHGQFAVGNTFYFESLGIGHPGGASLYADLAITLNGATGPGAFLSVGTGWSWELHR